MKSRVTLSLAGIVGTVGLSLAQPAAASELPALPSSPIVINVVDVAGQLALTQKSMEDYRKAHPELVSKFNFTKAPAPELPGKLKAQQSAGRVDIDVVLSGTDAISAGLEQGLWVKILPDYTAKFPSLDENYLPGALDMQKPTEGQAIEVVFAIAGPMLEYAPERVKDPPKTTDALLAWCKAHPNRFFYARPANSGPGRAFLQGLPYILGDSNPRDPINGWAKTWAYLKELNSCIEYYPSGTGATMKELGEGSRDIIVSMPGWDINPRVLGTVPKSAETTILEGPAGFKWVSDAQYVGIPKGLAPDHLAVVLDLIAFMLKPQQQAYAWDEGYFYPGPAIKNVPLTMAPKESQDTLKEFGRPEYDELIAKYPIMTPLFGKDLVAAFHKWDEEIGAQKLK
ncbi:MAG TPA: extracellular solute-binding protein [Alphaproteobacteria bacterium]|nr:extracellular solute-binding protein [Alphaproteobacteria bacterium]